MTLSLQHIRHSHRKAIVHALGHGSAGPLDGKIKGQKVLLREDGALGLAPTSRQK